jgi:hypothetical protein
MSNKYLEFQIAQTRADLASLKLQLGLTNEGAVGATPPHSLAELDSIGAPEPRFLVTHRYTVTPGLEPLDNLLTFMVNPGTWWRDKVAYTWQRAEVKVPAAEETSYQMGKWYVVAELAPVGEPPALACTVRLYYEDDSLEPGIPAFPPTALDQSDYRVLAVVYADGAEGAEMTAIRQRWFSDIYDGGDTMAQDWDLVGPIQTIESVPTAIISWGRLHWHGHGTYGVTEATNVPLTQATGYIYLHFYPATQTFDFSVEVDYLDSSSDDWAFLLYEIENYEIIRDLRGSINFGSPI